MSNSRESTGPIVEQLEARAYSRATELPIRVKEAILNIFPDDIREYVVISEESVEGYQGIPILIITGSLPSKQQAEQTVTHLFQQLSSGDLDYLQKSIDQRIDDDCTLFLRIDKQAAYLKRIEMTMNADVIQLQISIRSWPRCSLSEAKNLIQQLISLAGK
ncbi:MAG: RNA-binding domain-containing protein [Candidatus Thorarchaeota archaeon]